MPFGDADLRIGAEVQLAAEHERDDARDVGLEGEPLQVVHQLDVLVEPLRNADRPFERRQLRRRAALLDALNPPLDFAHRVDVVVRPWSRSPAPSRRCSRASSSVTESRMLLVLARLRAAAAPTCRRRRTAARTPRAGCSRSAAAWSASATTACSCRRSCSRSRSCRPGSSGRRRARATAARVSLPSMARRDLIGRDAVAARRRLRCASGARRSATCSCRACDRRSRRRSSTSA